MARRHPLEDIVSELSGDFKDLRREASKSKVVPLGKEKVSRQQLMDRFGQMSPVGREKLAREMIGQLGIDKFMDMMRSKDAGR